VTVFLLARQQEGHAYPAQCTRGCSIASASMRASKPDQYERYRRRIAAPPIIAADWNGDSSTGRGENRAMCANCAVSIG